ncbi:hypothetical protein GCG54_00003625 [Colletotrichum gloeosporioides]|uniref:Amidohydrolase-related domain-containing protein n=1 Tax=Colletotrichum gloeosporioides TaxID=474922 RepID=A0A8H4FRM6_COLGL|nr:uncharacterized protein GCG54_00003625 [Colletotrichum gloeosporioides]KAF3811877.1 hypothetical protein GCG54_00003625 [Colletotrichum gloeosporioides]
MPSIIRFSRLLRQSFAELIDDGAVVINGNRIEDVGPWDSIKAKWQDLPVTNLGDVTLMPGLFDCHACTDVNLPDEELLPLMQRNAAKFLDAGVTTARDLGARGMTAIAIREMIKDGTILGPRPQCANAPLAVAGGHAHIMGGVCEDVEGVRAEVRKRVAEGADVIKVMATGGFMTAGSHPSTARFSQAEMDAIADEAKKAGLPVTTHATGTEGIERAVNACFNSIEHCAWISSDDKAVFDRAVARNSSGMNTACVESDYFCPWDSRHDVVSNLSLLRESGVRIIVGTDAGIGFCPFERYADGLTVLADAGYTPREIIAAATTVAAKECNLDTECGKIEPGFAFVGNPLEDIKCIAKPCFVMAAGRRHELTSTAPVGYMSNAKSLTLQALRKGAGLV